MIDSKNAIKQTLDYQTFYHFLMHLYNFSKLKKSFFLPLNILQGKKTFLVIKILETLFEYHWTTCLKKHFV